MQVIQLPIIVLLPSTVLALNVAGTVKIVHVQTKLVDSSIPFSTFREDSFIEIHFLIVKFEYIRIYPHARFIIAKSV